VEAYLRPFLFLTLYGSKDSGWCYVWFNFWKEPLGASWTGDRVDSRTVGSGGKKNSLNFLESNRGHYTDWTIMAPQSKIKKKVTGYTDWLTSWSQNPKVCQRVHNRPPPVPVLSQLNPLHALPQPVSPRSILIPSSLLRLDLRGGLFSSGFPIKTLYAFLSSPMRATCPAHVIIFDLMCLMILGIRTNYETPHCATFWILLLRHPS
jgi:hypothetical protein